MDGNIHGVNKVERLVLDNVVLGHEDSRVLRLCDWPPPLTWFHSAHFLFTKSTEKFSMKPEWAERLRWLREEQDASGEAFGKSMGYSKAHISKLESGFQDKPTLEFLDALERVHRVNRTWLVEGKGSPFVSQETISEQSAAHLNESGTPRYRTETSPLTELRRALEFASAAATKAGRTDFSRVLLDLIDQIQPPASHLHSPNNSLRADDK
jgi:transcriptional regulator with XRE-family HTH domain